MKHPPTPSLFIAFGGLSLDRSWLGQEIIMYRMILILINKLFLIFHIYYILTGIDHVLGIPRLI